jgi:hypothetical protein
VSRIYIHVYDGDAGEYDVDNETGSIGQRVSVRSGASREFCDGEELAAAIAIVELLRDAKHFDVRQEMD